MKRGISTLPIRTIIWCGDGIESLGVLSALPELVWQTTGATEGVALEASLSYPFGIVIDRTGHLLVADTFNHRIREIAL